MYMHAAHMWPHKEHVMCTVHISHSMNMLYTLCKSTAILSAKDNVHDPDDLPSFADRCSFGDYSSDSHP